MSDKKIVDDFKVQRALHAAGYEEGVAAAAKYVAKKVGIAIWEAEIIQKVKRG